MRIKNADLEILVKRINNTFNIKNPTYSTIGAFDLDYAYGGVQLVRYENECGAVSDVFRCGHIKKRELYDMIHAFLTGINLYKHNN